MVWGFGRTALTLENCSTTSSSSSQTAITLKSALVRAKWTDNTGAQGSEAVMTSRSTGSFTSASRDSAAATLRAGHVSYPARSSARPSQKAKPKSSSTIRIVIKCLDSQTGHQVASNRFARRFLFCYQTLGMWFQENLRPKLKLGREKCRKLAQYFRCQ